MSQRPLLPGNGTPSAQVRVFGAPDGAVLQHTGRYARESVMVAFEMIGGVDRLADWAGKNPGEFFTKLFTKVVTREVEVNAGSGIEDLLAHIDGAKHSLPAGPVVEADYSIEQSDND